MPGSGTAKVQHPVFFILYSISEYVTHALPLIKDGNLHNFIILEI